MAQNLGSQHHPIATLDVLRDYLSARFLGMLIGNASRPP